MSSLQRSLYVTGLPLDYKVDDLRSLFDSVGKIERCVLIQTSVGTFTGNAYVTLANESDVRGAPPTLSEEGVRAQAIDQFHSEEFRLLMGDNQEDRFANFLKSLSGSEQEQMMSMMGKDVKKESPSFPTLPNVQKAPQVFVQEYPKVSVFSGTSGKDSSFARWKNEVECLTRMGTYEAQVILHSVRKSLRSPAADIITHVDQGASIEELVAKLESIYGTVLSGSALLQKFYSEVQKDKETCAEWACRLEDIGFQAQEKRMVTGAALKDVLKTQFWSGLRDHRIKEALRHQQSQSTFQHLVVEARELEEEYHEASAAYKDDQVKAKLRAQQAKPSELELLTELVKKMDMRMSQMEQFQRQSVGTPVQRTSMPPGTYAPTVSGGCGKCGQNTHGEFGCRAGTQVGCYNCGQRGHISRSCRVAAQTHHLNGKQPQ